MENKYLVSVDLGGTKILSALVNENNEIVTKLKVPTDSSKGGDYLAQVVANSANQLLISQNLSESDITAIAIGVPGSVDPNTGLIGIAPNLGLKKFNIKEAIANYSNIPVLIENDVNLGALGILGSELNGETTNALVVFVGTGIGGALIFDKKLYRGSHFFAGEIGHMKLPGYEEVCGCGSKGCFEALASRTAMVNTIRREIRKGKKSIISKLIDPKEKIKSKTLKLALKEKDPVVVKVVNDASIVIGETIGSIINLINVDTVVLGGGVIESLTKFMLPLIQKGFKRTALKDLQNVKFMATELGDDAAIKGGWTLANEFLK